jgi:hypothetical protein
MNRKSILSLTTVVAAFSVAALAGFLTVAHTSTSEPILKATPSLHASWTSDALTVGKQLMESDLVARVQVVEQGETEVVLALPRDRALQRSIRETGRRMPEIPFTRSQVEILEVYSGTAQVGDRFELLQTGGLVEGELVQVAEDPLYQVGGEHVLFLKDISADTVHGAAAHLFRTLNPASRYDLLGDQVVRTVDLGDEAAMLNLDGLVSQIRVAQTQSELPTE